ncbi:MAG: hypothetical protein RLZZ292_2168, partial [Bacteroidota bacterium]
MKKKRFISQFILYLKVAVIATCLPLQGKS